MPLTENDLRDLLTERSATPPAAPDRVRLVHTRVRRRQQRHGVAVALTAVVVAAVAVPLLRGQGAVAPVTPVSPGPTTSASPAPVAVVTQTAVVDGLRITTTGPRDVVGSTPSVVTVSAVNTRSTTWTGSLGAGVLRRVVAGATIESLLDTTGSPASWQNIVIALPTPTQVLDGAYEQQTSPIEPGATRTVTVVLVRFPGSIAATPPINGWVPIVESTQHHATYPDGTTYPTLGFTTAGSSGGAVDPAAVTRACDGEQTQVQETLCVNAIADQLQSDAIAHADGARVTHEAFLAAYNPLAQRLVRGVGLVHGAGLVNPLSDTPVENPRTDPLGTTWLVNGSTTTLWACFTGGTVTVSPRTCTAAGG